MEIKSQKIICDNPLCNYWVKLEAKDILKYVNTPCPRCGENLLTEADLDHHLKLLAAIQNTPNIAEEGDKTEYSISAKDGIFRTMPADELKTNGIRKWTLEGHTSQIGNTGDYDGHYELTDGVTSLITKDDVCGEDAARLTAALNDTGVNWESWQLDNAKFELHLEKENCLKWKAIATMLYHAAMLPHGYSPHHEADYLAKEAYKEALKNLP